MRRHNVENIDLEIESIRCFNNPSLHADGFIISWSSSIGFGEYTIWWDNDRQQWVGDSEGMDRDDDTEFLEELLSRLSKYIVAAIEITS